MKKIFLSALLLCATIVGASAFPRILINPGHGGHDSDDRPTAMPLGVPMFYESDGNLTRGIYLRDFFKELGGTISGEKGTVGGTNTLAMTRITNYTSDDLNLTYIATLSNNHGGYFISLHTNGGNASANYTIGFYRGATSSPYSQVVSPSKQMALEVAQEHQATNITNTTYSTARSQSDYAFWGWNYGVLRTNTRPGYLMEAWFHDYRPETLRLKSDMYNRYLAWQTARGFYDSPGGIGKLKGCIIGDVRDLTKGCGYTSYTTRGRDSYLAINNATVTLYNSSGTQVQQVKTDNYCNGVFAFFGLTAGTYTIKVSGVDGYKTADASVTVSDNTATKKQFDLVAGVDTGIALDPTTANFGETTVGNTSNKVVTVTGNGLSANISISHTDATNFYVDHTSLGATGGSFTVRYQPQSAGSHSTTISFVSGTQKASMVITGTAKNPPLTFTEGWNYSETSGNKAAWMADYTSYRNMAFGNGKLYVVDAVNAVIKVINAQTGEHIKDMNMTGIADGAAILCDVAYVDGKIVATNIATKTDNATTTTKENVLKVYVWDNDDAAPSVLLETTDLGSCPEVDSSGNEVAGTSVGMDRIGDAIEIKGDLTNGTICYLAQQARYYNTTNYAGAPVVKSGNCNSLVTYTITDGVASKTPTVANIDGFIIGVSPRVIPYGSDYIVAGQNYRPSVVTGAGELSKTVAEVALDAVQGNDMAVFTFKGDTYAFATDYDPTKDSDGNGSIDADEASATGFFNGRAALIDLNAGFADATRVANYPSTGLSAKTQNKDCSSSICVNVNGDSGVEMWVLVRNQGIAYYKHGTPATYNPGETPSTPTTPSEPTVLYSKGLTKIWQNTTNVPGSAAYNGTGPRYAAVSNGNLIVADNAGKNGSGKILKVTETGYSDYYDPSAAITANYSQVLGSAIANDDAGNILVNSGFSAAGSGSNFTIISADLSKTYKLDLAAAGITGYTTGVRTDQVGRIRGNMLSAEGAYVAFVPNSVTYAVVVKVVNGAVDASKSGVITTGFTSNAASDIAQPAYETVGEMSNNASSFYLRTRGFPASVYYEGAKKYTFSNKTTEGYTTTGASTEGFDWFKLGGKSYFIMSMTTDGTSATRGSYFGIYDEDGNIVAYWTEGQKTGLGAAAGSFVVVPADDYSVFIYHFVPNTVAEKLRFAIEDMTTGIESIDAEEADAPVEYYNLQGVRVMNPENGLYIKRQGKKATKVVL